MEEVEILKQDKATKKRCTRFQLEPRLVLTLHCRIVTFYVLQGRAIHCMISNVKKATQTALRSKCISLFM